MDSYIFDVFIDIPPKYKTWVIDINPWIPYTVDSLLFEWDELENKETFGELGFKSIEN